MEEFHLSRFSEIPLLPRLVENYPFLDTLVCCLDSDEEVDLRQCPFPRLHLGNGGKFLVDMERLLELRMYDTFVRINKGESNLLFPETVEMPVVCRGDFSRTRHLILHDTCIHISKKEFPNLVSLQVDGGCEISIDFFLETLEIVPTRTWCTTLDFVPGRIQVIGEGKASLKLPCPTRYRCLSRPKFFEDMSPVETIGVIPTKEVSLSGGDLLVLEETPSLNETPLRDEPLAAEGSRKESLPTKPLSGDEKILYCRTDEEVAYAVSRLRESAHKLVGVSSEEDHLSITGEGLHIVVDLSGTESLDAFSELVKDASWIKIYSIITHGTNCVLATHRMMKEAKRHGFSFKDYGEVFSSACMYDMGRFFLEKGLDLWAEHG